MSGCSQPGRYWSVYRDISSFITFTLTFSPQSSSFHLPEVEFWCSPAELGLAPGTPPSARLSPAPAPGNTTDPCLMWDLDYGGLDTEDMVELGSGDTVPNTTHCSRWDFDRSSSPESVVSQFSLVCR